MSPYHKLTKTTTITTTYNNSSIRSGIMNKISYNQNITKETDRQCRLFQKFDEHIISACSILAQKVFFISHSKLGQNNHNDIEIVMLINISNIKIAYFIH
jgi:hypothetical protein